MFFLLELRDRIKSIYQKFDVYFNVLFKFIFSLLLFLSINSIMGFDTRFSSALISVVLAVMGAFLPVSLLTFLAVVLLSIHLMKISYICVIMLLAIYAVLWLFLLRYSSKYGYVLLAMPVLCHFGVAYFMPLLVGIIATPVAAIPIFCGTIIYYLLGVCVGVNSDSASVNPDEILQLFRYVMNTFITNKQMYITAVMLVLVCIIVYVIRRRKIDYSKEIAISVGAVLNVVLFLIGNMIVSLDISIAGLIIWSLVSAAIVYIIGSYIRILDYSSVETVQFEDDDYYYYVKAVPKAKVTMSQNRVKNITDMTNEEFEHASGDESYKLDDELRRMIDYETDREYSKEDYDRVDDFNGVDNFSRR